MLKEHLTRTLALAVALSVATPFASATFAASGTPQDTAAAPAGPSAAVTVTGSGQAHIDGVAATTGATIFSGSRITTDKGTTATVAVGGSRIMIGDSTDAVFSMNGSAIRLDIVCGSATGSAAAGSTVDVYTKDDTNVHAQAGGLQVAAEGRTMSLGNDEQQSFNGGTHITANENASFEAATVLCSCKCAAPTAFPTTAVAAGGISAALIAALLAGAAAAIAIPIIVTGEEPETPPVTPPQQSQSAFV